MDYNGLFFLPRNTVVETCLGNDATILDKRLNTVAPNILQCDIINSKLFINALISRLLNIL